MGLREVKQLMETSFYLLLDFMLYRHRPLTISEPSGQDVFSQRGLHSHVEPTSAGVKELLSLGEDVEMSFCVTQPLMAHL